MSQSFDLPEVMLYHKPRLAL